MEKLDFLDNQTPQNRIAEGTKGGDYCLSSFEQETNLGFLNEGALIQRMRFHKKSVSWIDSI